MEYPLRKSLRNVDSLSKLESQPVPIDYARMEKLDQLFMSYLTLLNILIGSMCKVDLLNKTRGPDRERNTLIESRQNKVLTPDEIEKLFGIGL